MKRRRFSTFSGMINEGLRVAKSLIVSGDSILVVKATGTQKDNLTDSKKEELAGAVNSIDSYSLQMALLSSDKVKNDVANVFFTKMMKN